MPISLIQKRLAIAALAGLGFSAAPAAAADDSSGFYVRANVGATGLGTDDLTLTADGVETPADADFTAGFTGGGALGYRYNNAVRVELDVQYRSSENDEVAFSGGPTYTDGNFASLTIGVTGFYDFDIEGDWTPYVGAGFAFVQEVDIDFEDDTGEISYEGDDSGFAVAAGLRYDPPQGQWFVDGEFRYLFIGEVDLDNDRLPGQVSADYDPWSVTIGLGYRY